MTRAMKLSALVAGAPGVKFSRPELELEITSLADDSRLVKPGSLFASLPAAAPSGPGMDLGGRARHESEALANGAVAILRTSEPRSAWAHICANFYGRPSEKLSMIGVTGTNGKTTVSFLLKSILEAAGKKSALLGTVGYYLGKRHLPAPNTTPGSLLLTQLLAQAVEEKAEAAVMEVSSHAMSQHRVEGCLFDVAVFTNLTQDHLDYHKSMAAYSKAKERLFSLLKNGGVGVVNLDDPAWKSFSKARKPGTRLLTFSASGKKSSLAAKDIKFSAVQTRFSLRWMEKSYPVVLPLPGRFNVSNALAAIAAGLGLGLELGGMLKALKQPMLPPGRFEIIKAAKGFQVVVDYAHTPDALERLLKTVKEITPGRVISVFGCGGDRDKGKRPLMGAISAKLADLTIITSDNPRSEDPDAIIDQIFSGIPSKAGEIVTSLKQPDRLKAITRAVRLAQKGDTVVLAGKGHEDSQVLATGKIHFSDQESARAAILALKGT
jgi:UDP-N-acetylmuramoyl-L-alanyl-D-glutamate--2,6-diaminopimelate ligase